MRSMRNGFSFTSSRNRILPDVSISHGVPSEVTTTERHPPVIAPRASPAYRGCTLDPAGKEKSNASPRSEARAALAELGYGPDEIRSALDAVADGGSVEELVRAALRELARSR